MEAVTEQANPVPPKIKNMSDELVLLRHQHHWTQEQLAEKLGVSVQAVRLWERRDGKRKPNRWLMPKVRDFIEKHCKRN